MNQIKAIRKAMGLSAEQIARAICVGAATVYRWESGECDLPSLMLCRLADLLGVTTDALLGRERQDAPIPVRDTIAAMVKASGLTYLQLESLTGIPHSALQRYVAGTTEKIPMDRMQRLVDILQKLSPGAPDAPNDQDHMRGGFPVDMSIITLSNLLQLTEMDYIQLRVPLTQNLNAIIAFQPDDSDSLADAEALYGHYPVVGLDTLQTGTLVITLARPGANS